MTKTNRLLASVTAASLMLSVSAAAVPAVSAVTAEDVSDIVVLGDSISTGYGLEDLEALSGQDIYSYTDYLSDYLDAAVTNYAVNGQRSEELLNTVKGYDGSSEEYQALAKAEMICVTIGGNDLLQPTKEYFNTYVTNYNTINGTNYTAKEVLKAVGSDSDAVKKLAMGLTSTLNNALKYVIGFSDITDIDGNITEEGYIGYIAELEQTLRTINSDAEIVFQTVYNPVSVPDSIAVDEDYAYALSQLRLMADAQIGKVNTAISKYAADYDISVADVKTAFANEDLSLSTEWVYMIHGDDLNALDVHPNQIGHAIIAAEVLDAAAASGSVCKEFNTALRSGKADLIATGVYEAALASLDGYVTVTDPSLTVSVGSVKANPGESVSLPVFVSGCDAVSDITVNYGSIDGCTIDGITPGSLFADGAQSAADQFEWTQPDGKEIDCTEQTVLFTMDITVPETVTEPTLYPVRLSAVSAADAFGNSIDISLTDGSIAAAVIRGDVNGDTLVDNNDAVLILKDNASTIIGKDSIFDDLQSHAADVDENGTVNTDDATCVLKYYAQGLIGTPDWDTVIPKN